MEFSTCRFSFCGGQNPLFKAFCKPLIQMCVENDNCGENYAASNFYEMRRNLNLVARSFYDKPCSFFGT